MGMSWLPGPPQGNAKRFFIESYFDALSDRIDFILTLANSGRRHEAMTLTCAYLDGLGNWLGPRAAGSAEGFCLTIIEHGGNPQFGLVVHKLLVSDLPWKSAPPNAESALTTALARFREFEAIDSETLEEAIKPLNDPTMAFVRAQKWRATIANVAYRRLRTPNAHALGSGDGISFSKATFRGSPVSPVDLAVLHDALKRVFSHARQLSLDTNDWFGISDALLNEEL